MGPTFHEYQVTSNGAELAGVFDSSLSTRLPHGVAECLLDLTSRHSEVQPLWGMLPSVSTVT